MLVAHYPLNGNTLDYSGNENHATNYGATIDNNGKIGKCYSFNGVNNYIDCGTSDFVNSFSISFWINFNSLPKTTRFLSDWHQKIDTDRWLFYANVDNTITFNVCSKNAIVQGSINSPINLSTWYHVCGLYDSFTNNIKLYLNGSLVGNKTLSGTLNPSTGVQIGKQKETGLALNGKMNDVRFYDNALSEKEIKELAKAKILHYSFNQFSEPTENYIDNGDFNIGDFTGWTNYNSGGTKEIVNRNGINFAKVTTTSGTFGIQSGNKLDVIEGEKVTISFIMKGDKPNYSYLMLTPSPNISIVSSIKYTEMDDGYLYGEYTWTATKDCKVSFMFTYNVIGKEAEVSFVQLEKKDHATPFTPSSRTGIVRDISGYRSDAVLDLATSPQWVNESKIGGGAYKFNGINHAIEAGIKTDTSEQITISLWFYPEHLPSEKPGLYEDIIDKDGDTWNFFMTGSRIEWKLVFEDGSSNPRASINQSSINKQQWNHLLGTYDGATAKVYANGVKISEANINKPLKRTGSILQIGRGSNKGYNFAGLIDDVRIYATALSEEDIKELYQTRASLDNQGNFYMSQLSNLPTIDALTRNTSITEKGIVDAPIVSELGITDGLIAYYPLDENAKDYSGNNLHGTVYGAILTDGIKGQCYDFNGIGDCIEFTSNLNNQETFSISLFTYLRDTSGLTYFLNLNPGGNLLSLPILYYIGSANQFGYWEGSNNFFHPGVKTNQWYNIVVTRTNTVVKMYVDGNLISSIPQAKSGITTSKIHMSKTNYLDGKIDEFRIYNRVLTEEEIKIQYDLYKQGGSKMKITNNGIYVSGEFKEGF